jgi:hypothetical protein
MEQFKRAKVIMLPTNNILVKGDLILRHLWKNTKYECNTLWQFKEDVVIGGVRQFTTLNGSFRDAYTSFKSQHLYIISDDEIKEGDWFIEEDCELPINAGYNKGLCENCKKIIATTDTSLTINTYYEIEGNQKVQLPQPSQQFIEKYIESYNKGEVITDVLVEYELYMQRQSNVGTTRYVVSKDNKTFDKLNFDRIPTLLGVKINPKENTITIKKLKDSWNREELEKIARNAFKAGVDKGIALEIYKTELDNNPKADENFDKIPTENKWIEENL